MSLESIHAVESPYFMRDHFVVWPPVVTVAPFNVCRFSSAHTEKSVLSIVRNALFPASPLLPCPLSSTNDYWPRFPKLIIDFLFARGATINAIFFYIPPLR